MLNNNMPSRTEEKEEDFLMMGRGHVHMSSFIFTITL